MQQKLSHELQITKSFKNFSISLISSFPASGFDVRFLVLIRDPFFIAFKIQVGLFFNFSKAQSAVSHKPFLKRGIQYVLPKTILGRCNLLYYLIHQGIIKQALRKNGSNSFKGMFEF